MWVGHFDIWLGLLLLYACLATEAWKVGLSIAAASAIKPTALAVLPFLFRKQSIKNNTIVFSTFTLASIALYSIFYASLPSLATNMASFSANWEFNSGFFRLLREAWSSFMVDNPAAYAKLTYFFIWLSIQVPLIFFSKLIIEQKVFLVFCLR